MTTTTDKLRGVFLAALMVLSVFAMTVAFTGTTAAAVNSAVEYNDGTIEVALSNSSVVVNSTNIQVTKLNSTGRHDLSSQVAPLAANGSTGEIQFSLANDVRPTETLLLNISGVATNLAVTPTGATVDVGTDTVSPSRVYSGTQVAVVTASPGATIDILKGSSRLNTRGTGMNSNVYVFDSTGAEVGANYSFDVQGGGNRSLTFADLDLSVSAPSSVTTTEPFGISATANDIDRDVQFLVLDANGDAVLNQTLSLGANGQATASFTLPAGATGDYTARVTDANSGVTVTSDTFTATAPAPGDIALASTIMTNQRGDVIPITLQFSGDADTGTVRLGSTDVNFNVTFDVVDGDDDGTATVLFNTAESDSLTEGTPGSLGTAFDTADNADTVTAVTVTDNVTEPVEATEYPVTVELGTDEVAVGTVIVEERSTTGVSVHTAPRGLTFNNASAVQDAMSTGDSEIAAGDLVIVQVQASGIFGYISQASDLRPPTNGVGLTVTEDPDTVDRNEDPITLTDYVNTTTLHLDPDNDQFFLVFSESSLGGGVDPNDEFDVTFDIWGNNTVTTGEEHNTSAFTVVNPTLSISVGGQQLVLPADENATVTGTSSLAPGSEVSVRLRSIGGTSPFTLQSSPNPTVQPDGTWSATFNLSGKADGQQFTATATAPAVGLTDTATGEIGTITADVSFSDQQAQQSGTLVVVDSVTLSQGGFVAIHEGSASGPVIGSSDYLGTGTHQNIRIRLDADSAVTGTQTLVAMPHKDTDGDRSYDFGVSGGQDDGPYLTSAGAPVVDDAQVSLATETPTVTPTPTATPTPTPTATPTATPTEMEQTPTEGDGDGDGDGGGGIPGFGAGIAVIALLGAALLAARRRS